jgi:hypothetical protein
MVLWSKAAPAALEFQTMTIRPSEQADLDRLRVTLKVTERLMVLWSRFILQREHREADPSAGCNHSW